MAHVIVLNEVSEDIFVCGRCKSVFAGIDIFLDHKKICSSKELCSLSLAKQSSNESVSGNTTTCPEVANANVRNDTTSSEITPGNSLMLQPQTPPLSCTECDKKFKSRRILLIHKKSHYNKKSFQCQICGRCFTQGSRLRRHILSHKVWPVGLGEAISMSVNEELNSDNEELLIRFSCPYCEMSFTSYNEFRSHLKNHQSMKQFKCIQNNCSSFHISVKELLHHVSLEHASPIYSCFACDEVCDTLDAIAKHQLTHKDINCRMKLYKCTQCDAAFNNLENLSFHKLSDNHEKVCIHCNRIFVSDKRLRLHLQLHREMKPFQCSACDQSFLEKKHFITHLARQFRVTDQVYLDLQREDKPLGRVVIGLFGDLAPKAVKNFKVLATKGIKGKSYKGTSFNRIIKRFMVQGGDVVNDDGSGSISIYGETFEDENLDTQHSMAGFVSMANKGKDTNGCQFIITTTGTPWLDNLHTVLGKVIEGQNIVHVLEHTPTDVEDRPTMRAYIADCGLLPTPQPFYISDDPYDLWAWIKASAVPLTMSFSILGFFHWMMRKMEI